MSGLGKLQGIPRLQHLRIPCNDPYLRPFPSECTTYACVHVRGCGVMPSSG